MRANTTTICFAILVSLVLCASSQTTGPASSDPGKTSETNTGEKILKVVAGVKPPRVLHSSEPNYSKQARKAKLEGVCVLWLVVGADGKPHDIRVQRTLGMGLDEEAINAVKKWTFEPARKDGQPVAVQINVEVSFRLY